MKNDENKIEKLEKTIGDLASEMRQGFSRVDKSFDRVDKAIEDLAISTAKGFDDQNERFDRRFDKLEKDNVWIKDTLEKQTATLTRLDQERIFSLHYIKRLEAEVDKIKKQLKIA